jgi:hypothetical protein
VLLLPVLILIVLVHACLWIYEHWKRSKEDIYYSFLYADGVERRLYHKSLHKDPKKPTYREFWKDGKCRAQMATTLILAVLVWFSIMVAAATPTGLPSEARKLVSGLLPPSGATSDTALDVMPKLFR